MLQANNIQIRRKDLNKKKDDDIQKKRSSLRYKKNIWKTRVEKENKKSQTLQTVIKYFTLMSFVA